MVRRARAVIERVLPGAHLTRDELQAEFARRGLVLAGPALAQVMMYAELDALVCSGPRRGKQSTYALLEERVPAAPVLDREAALAELTRRYFQSHGPATARDFSWWSGLTLADVRTGIASLGRSLTRVDWEGTAYYYVAGDEPGRGRGAWLLPNYDEFTVAYADRSLLIGPDFPTQLNPRANPIFNNVILVHGVIAGTWRRTLTKKDVKIALSPFRPLPATTRRAVLRASHRFRAFAL
jgi:hypothetical protein